MTDGDARPNSWDADQYDADHSFVYEHGSDLVELLAPRPDERILDLGCGTGHLTAEIADQGGTVVGLDSAQSMIAEARETYPELSFAQGDARTVAVENRDPFDAVFSNAALHWIPDADQDAVLESVRDALVPGGRFVAELGGTGNVARIVEATLAELERRGYEADHPWYFPSVGEYATRLEDHGFEVRDARLFDRPTLLEGEAGMRRWLEMFGDSLFEPLSATERTAVIDAVEERLEPDMYNEDDQTWIADYRRLRFRAVSV